MLLAMRHYAYALALLATVSLSIGCSPHKYSLRPYVEIDKDFSPDEAEKILTGMDVWATSSNATFLDPVFVSHLQIIADWEANPDAPHIFFYHNSVAKDPACPFGPLPGSSLAATHTENYNNNNAIVCVDPLVGLKSDTYQWAMTHEIGHALGLPHLEQPVPGGGVLMFWEYGIHSAQVPTCLDLSALAQVHPGEQDVPDNCMIWHNEVVDGE